MPVPAGATAVIWLAELTVKLEALTAPNLTAVTPEKLAPVITTVVPPAVLPEVTLSEVTAGALTKVNWSAAEVELVPPGAVTVMSTVPVPAGVVAVIEVELLTVKLVALVPPNLTAVAPVKLLPVIVTTVPPAVGPAVGEVEVTVGANCTVRVAAVVVAEPTLLVKTARYWLPFWPEPAVKLKVVAVAPAMFWNVAPPSVDCCHCTVAKGLPLAAAVKVVVFPATTEVELGLVVTDGAKSTVRVAADVVAEPVLLVKTARNLVPF